MQSNLFLARSAELRGGRANAQGLGWTTTSAESPMAVLVVVSGGHEDAGSHEFALELVDDEGFAITGPRIDTNEVCAIRVEGDFVATSPSHAPLTTAMNTLVCVAWHAGGLPLQPGAYEWRFSVDGTECGSCAFEVVAQ